MATYRNRKGRITAIVRRTGHKDLYRTFDTKRDAVEWATKTEANIFKGVNADHTEAEKLGFLEAAKQYETAMMPKAKHPAKLKSQLKIIKQSDLIKFSVAKLTPKVIAEWRDERLKYVSIDTVIKDINKVSAIFSWLEKERYVELPNGNPVKKVTKPKRNPNSERTRRTTPKEVQALLHYFKQRNNTQMIRAIMLALMTGLRREELINTNSKDINFEDETLRIPKTKNSYAREIPLHTVANKLLLAAFKDTLDNKDGDGKLFRLKPDSVSQAFSRACKALKIENLRWHDLRHEAISRMFERGQLSMAEIATISGHRSFDMLKRYTHLKAKDMNKKIRAR